MQASAKSAKSSSSSWTAGLSITDSRLSLYEGYLAAENAQQNKINPKFRTFHKSVNLESRCWVLSVAAVTEHAAVHTITGNGICDLRMRVAGLAVGSGGGVSVFDCETGKLCTVIQDDDASRRKVAVCVSNPPSALQVGPLIAVGTTEQPAMGDKIKKARAAGERVIEIGRLILMDLLTHTILYDRIFPTIVTCVAMYEGWGGVKMRNAVMLSGDAQAEADAALSGVPLLPSIAVAGCGHRVTVWAFESGGGGGGDDDGGDAVELADGHADGSTVLGVCVCVAKTAVLGSVRALIISCGSDEQVLVYDMNTRALQRALRNGCVASSVAAICVETQPTEATATAAGDDGGDDEEENSGGIGGLMRPATSGSARDVFAAADRLAASRRPSQRVWVVAGGFDGKVRVWDYDNGRRSPRHAMEGHTGSVLSVAIIPPPLPPNPKAFNRSPGAVSGSTDGVLRVWHLERGECLAQIRAHDNHITSVAVTVASGRPLVVTGSRDNKVRRRPSCGDAAHRTPFVHSDTHHPLRVTISPRRRSACGTSRPTVPPCEENSCRVPPRPR